MTSKEMESELRRFIQSLKDPVSVELTMLLWEEKQEPWYQKLAKEYRQKVLRDSLPRHADHAESAS